MAQEKVTSGGEVAKKEKCTRNHVLFCCRRLFSLFFFSLIFLRRGRYQPACAWVVLGAGCVLFHLVGFLCAPTRVLIAAANSCVPRTSCDWTSRRAFSPCRLYWRGGNHRRVSVEPLRRPQWRMRYRCLRWSWRGLPSWIGVRTWRGNAESPVLNGRIIAGSNLKLGKFRNN